MNGYFADASGTEKDDARGENPHDPDWREGDALKYARNCFLDFMADGEWEEQPDADINESGRQIDCTTHKLIVSEHCLAVLAEALGITAQYNETTKQAIERAVQA
jgi:hypothetical protein